MTKRWWSYKKHFQNCVCSKLVFIVPLFLNFVLQTRHGWIRTGLFWVIMQRVVVISYWRFRTTNRSYLQGSILQKERC
jgi:hypothetical protein